MSVRPDSWIWAAVRTAVVVGVLLTLANQWSQLRAGPYDRNLLMRALVNFAVPFAVSAYSRFSALRALREQR